MNRYILLDLYDFRKQSIVCWTTISIDDLFPDYIKWMGPRRSGKTSLHLTDYLYYLDRVRFRSDLIYGTDDYEMDTTTTIENNEPGDPGDLGDLGYLGDHGDLGDLLDVD